MNGDVMIADRLELRGNGCGAIVAPADLMLTTDSGISSCCFSGAAMVHEALEAADG